MDGNACGEDGHGPELHYLDSIAPEDEGFGEERGWEIGEAHFIRSHFKIYHGIYSHGQLGFMDINSDGVDHNFGKKGRLMSSSIW